MRVARWYNNNDVRIEEMPVPEIGPDELLVKVEASGICGSDVMEWYRINHAPLILGHEIAGEIVDAGEGVSGYKTGDRVTVAHHVPCNTCKYCLSGNHTVCATLRTTNFYPGGFAEYVRIPAINVDRGVFKLPDDMSWHKATFIEPLACVLRGLRKTGLKPGMTVLVIGSGIAGLLYVQLARAFGAGKIFATDITDYRLAMAEKFGADHAYKADLDISDEVRKNNNGYAADVVIVCAGAVAAVQQALLSVEPDGTVLFFAATGPGVEIPFSVNDLFWRNDLTLTTSYAASPADYQQALEMVARGVIDTETMITHVLPMADTAKGFKLVAEANESIKVIIEPNR